MPLNTEPGLLVHGMSVIQFFNRTALKLSAKKIHLQRVSEYRKHFSREHLLGHCFVPTSCIIFLDGLPNYQLLTIHWGRSLECLLSKSALYVCSSDSYKFEQFELIRYRVSPLTSLLFCTTIFSCSDIERDNILCVHSPCYIVRSTRYDQPVLFG